MQATIKRRFYIGSLISHLEASCTEQVKTQALLYFKGIDLVFFTNALQIYIHSSSNNFKKYPFIF